MLRQMNIDELFSAMEQTPIVKQISYNDTIPFLLDVHYARRIPCIQYAFGIYYGGELCGVVTYGQPASPSLCVGVAGKENRSRVIELNRLAILPKYNGRDFASRLVARSLRMLPHKTFVVSYADWGGWRHVGYVYQATNFLYTGLTKQRTDIYSCSGHSRHYDKNETRRQIRTAKHRYIFLCGNKKEKREMLRALKYPIISQYPKGDSRHYDVKNPKPFQSERGEK